MLALLLAFLLDQLLGDPPRWPHPVRWIGWLIVRLEGILRPHFPPRLAGVFLLVLVLLIVGTVVVALLALADWCHPWVETALTTVLIYWGLAARSLARETRFVLEACADGDWVEARQRLSHIVGRDTAELPPEQIYRACVETVGENTSDGVIAPLFYAGLFGPLGLWLYKAINTLDSMVGYRNEQYRDYGWASARTDDVANWLPARLTWLLLSAAALLTRANARQALRIGWRDGHKHPSPNSAWGEATVAGALAVQLGGASTYAGVPSEKPHLGDGDAPLTLATVEAAIRLMLTAAWLMLAVALALRLAVMAIVW